MSGLYANELMEILGEPDFTVLKSAVGSEWWLRRDRLVLIERKRTGESFVVQALSEPGTTASHWADNTEWGIPESWEIYGPHETLDEAMRAGADLVVVV